MRVAHAAGVLMGAGTDFGGGSARANQLAWEVESLVETGLEPWEALAAVTWRAGEIMDEPEAGQIREGGKPDFFLVHGDWLPGAIIVAASSVGFARQVTIIRKLCSTGYPASSPREKAVK